MTYGESPERVAALMSQLLDMSGVAAMPARGCSAEEVLTQLAERRAQDPDVHSNHLFGLVYPSSDPELERVVAQANAMFLWGNALNILKFPNLTRLEFEIVSMT